ncbi:MAG: YdgA family protein [Burkholderiaceae bacterium]|nr:YdgA family protein [Burkholderiaceae bacterium]
MTWKTAILPQAMHCYHCGHFQGVIGMGKAAVFGVAAVVVAGGAYIGAAAYSGSLVQKQYDAAFDKMARTLPFIKIVDRKYDKGLFSSTASYGLRLGCDLQEGSAATITVRDTIVHGPFPDFAGVGAARIDTQIVLPPDALPSDAPESLRQWIGGIKPEAIRTMVGFDGAFTTRVELPAGEVKEDEGRLHWQAMRATFRMNGARTHLSYNLDVPEVAFDLSRAGETGSLKLVNLRVQSDSELANLLMTNGTSTGSLDSLQLASSKAGLFVDLNQVKLTSSGKTENDLLGATTSVTGALDIKVGGKSFRFDKIELQESLKRIHAPTLQKITLGIWQELGGICRKTPAELAQSLQGKQAEMLLGFKQLLIYNPEYSVDKIAVTYEGQEGTLAYSVAASGVTDQDLQQPDVRNLLNKVTAKASARLPVAWLEKIAAESAGGKVTPQEIHAKIDAAISQMNQAGYVVREGDFIASAALFEHGQLTVNGKPLDSRALMMGHPGHSGGGEANGEED